MASAIARLGTARSAVEGDPAGAVSAAYYACLYAARAALSERDRHARTHRGTWHLFYEAFVVSGPFDAGLYGAASAMQPIREAADYDAAALEEEEAEALVGTAARFVEAVRAMLA